MKDPQPIGEGLKTFAPWQCTADGRPPGSPPAQKCASAQGIGCGPYVRPYPASEGPSPDADHWMTTCLPYSDAERCPPAYPWVDDPNGDGRRMAAAASDSVGKRRAPAVVIN